MLNIELNNEGAKISATDETQIFCRKKAQNRKNGLEQKVAPINSVTASTRQSRCRERALTRREPAEEMEMTNCRTQRI